MITALVAAFLVVHGLLHPGIWSAPWKGDESAPFDPGHSWVLAAVHVPSAPVRAVASALSWYTAVAYVVAGAGVLADTDWWDTAALTAACTGLVLKLVWYDRWLTVGVLLDVGVLLAVAYAWPASVH
ncbi:hypothetical protein [Streptomyces sp. Da 82-17]|uniref:hypothetical protein n=1 Tax=Streptomyces sp. Da 82-17 TaxID=3377116 RepID=UPI0038D464C3